MKKNILIYLLVIIISVANVFSQANSEKGKAYIVSNAHFDTQWNWDVQRSISEFIPKTMNQNFMLFQKYPNVKDIVWTQEEPKNQGAWLFIAPRLYDDVMKSAKPVRISYAGREASAAPACGSPYLHAKQQAQLVNDALAIVAE
jgi:2-oxoglutarate dehydrogenase complex dehydrogenase (E1) component-like enzyme